jgi:hypothetical protein
MENADPPTGGSAIQVMARGESKESRRSMLLRIFFLTAIFCQLIGSSVTDAAPDHGARLHAQICQTGATSEAPRPGEPSGPCDCCFFCGACGDHPPFLRAHDHAIGIYRPSKEFSARPWDDDHLSPQNSRGPQARAPPV